MECLTKIKLKEGKFDVENEMGLVNKNAASALVNKQIEGLTNIINEVVRNRQSINLDQNEAAQIAKVMHEKGLDSSASAVMAEVDAHLKKRGMKKLIEDQIGRKAKLLTPNLLSKYADAAFEGIALGEGGADSIIQEICQKHLKVESAVLATLSKLAEELKAATGLSVGDDDVRKMGGVAFPGTAPLEDWESAVTQAFENWSSTRKIAEVVKRLEERSDLSRDIMRSAIALGLMRVDVVAALQRGLCLKVAEDEVGKIWTQIQATHEALSKQALEQNALMFWECDTWRLAKEMSTEKSGGQVESNDLQQVVQERMATEERIFSRLDDEASKSQGPPLSSNDKKKICEIVKSQGASVWGNGDRKPEEEIVEACMKSWVKMKRALTEQSVWDTSGNSVVANDGKIKFDPFNQV
jgi:hypothetical protein